MDEPLGATATGDDAEPDLGHAEARGPAGDDDVAGQGQFAATAESQALDRGDHRLRVAAEVGPDVPAARGPIAEEREAADGVERGDVGSGAEHAAGPGEHDRADRVIVADGGQCVVQAGQHGLVQAVLRGRSGDRQGHQVPVAFDQQRRLLAG